eukprot:TRINITY_DN562_c0_g1_i1.p1 TRINITY_DN562_c0_g1~~TRINITY_DN562_c0_g1_i1.p1  ORF type:complete len:226 (+),score=15.51 TRINITY_DN562_c0_g1_i1:61-678(+)
MSAEKQVSAADGQPEALVKLLLLGDSGVGKSSMLLRFADDEFDETYINTIGIDFKTRTVDVQDKRIKLQIWDTAGQERFQSLQALYYRGAQGIVLVYDLTKAKTFQNIRQWMGAVEKHATSGVVRMLVGNKADLDALREVTREEGQRLANEYHMTFVECSAKAGSGVNDAFLSVASQILQHGLPAAPQKTTKVTEELPEKKGCCN